jgi:hypothetical protein
VTRLEGVKQKTEVDPKVPVELGKPVNVKLLLTDAFNNSVPGMVFQVKTVASRTGAITVSGGVSESMATNPMVRQFRIRFPLSPDARNMADGRIKELEGMMKGKHGQGLRGEERTKVQQGIQFFGLVLQFDDLLQGMNEASKIHYRIFLDIDGRQVDIVRTEPPQAEKKGGGKKA